MARSGGCPAWNVPGERRERARMGRVVVRIALRGPASNGAMDLYGVRRAGLFADALRRSVVG